LRNSFQTVCITIPQHAVHVVVFSPPTKFISQWHVQCSMFIHISQTDSIKRLYVITPFTETAHCYTPFAGRPTPRVRPPRSVEGGTVCSTMVLFLQASTVSRTINRCIDCRWCRFVDDKPTGRSSGQAQSKCSSLGDVSWHKVEWRKAGTPKEVSLVSETLSDMECDALVYLLYHHVHIIPK